MYPNRVSFWVIVTSSLAAFVGGSLVSRYEFFPYQQLKVFRGMTVGVKDLGHSDYYYDKKSFFEIHGRADYEVVFVGDSITDMAEWEDLFPTLEIANRGISGDRTDGLLNRLDSIASTNAEKVFIMIGINDIFAGVPVADIFNNYEAIVDRLWASEHTVEIYVQSTILAGRRYQDLNDKVARLNQKLRQMTATRESVTYIDLNQALGQDAALNPDYTRDDIHLNGRGYGVWKQQIEAYLE